MNRLDKVKEMANLLTAPGNAVNALSLGSRTPAAKPAKDRLNDHRIVDAMNHEMYRQGKTDSAGNAITPLIGKAKLVNPPEEGGFVDAAMNPSPYASNYLAHGTDPSGNKLDINKISINPNADEAFLFHELGHIANRQGGVGEYVRNLRDDLAAGNNPRLGEALFTASILAPGLVTALTPGDDDGTAAMAAALLPQGITIADELMATNTGLRMMETAGTRASIGQRGKLAGSLLSYLAPAVGASVIAGGIGNQFDQNV